jgi:DNA-binding transcriptional regulator YhcF (GntR family)
MKPEIKIDTNLNVPIYKQLIQAIEHLVNSGLVEEGEFIPSMNELSNRLNISKETVKKAYTILRSQGLMESSLGKGFYVTNNGKKKIKILLLFDKLSTYKQVLYNAFYREISEVAEITIRLHNQDISLFEDFIKDNLDNFDFYIITPHFSLERKTQERAIKALKKIPNRKLVILDKYMDQLIGNYGCVYQDFENDIFEGLSNSVSYLKKYKKLNLVSMPGSIYASLIKAGIQRFCSANSIVCEYHTSLETCKIKKQEVFLILNSQLDLELIELVRLAKKQGFKIGKDIGIISYNESPINEIVLDGLTVFSTDFEQMGKLAAQMITEKSLKKVRCNFRLIRRHSF